MVCVNMGPDYYKIPLLTSASTKSTTHGKEIYCSPFKWVKSKIAQRGTLAHHRILMLDRISALHPYFSDKKSEAQWDLLTDPTDNK